MMFYVRKMIILGQIRCYRVPLSKNIVDLQSGKDKAELTPLFEEKKGDGRKELERNKEPNETTVYTCLQTGCKYVHGVYDEPPFMVDSECRDAAYDDYYRYLDALTYMHGKDNTGVNINLLKKAV